MAQRIKDRTLTVNLVVSVPVCEVMVAAATVIISDIT